MTLKVEIDLNTPKDCFEFARNNQDKITYEMEQIIATSSSYSRYYAEIVMKGERFLLGEPIIAKDPEEACQYAICVLHGRFPEAEPVISQFADESFTYAQYVIENRWEQGEKAIRSNPEVSKMYDVFLDSIKLSVSFNENKYIFLSKDENEIELNPNQIKHLVKEISRFYNIKSLVWD